MGMSAIAKDDIRKDLRTCLGADYQDQYLVFMEVGQ